MMNSFCHLAVNLVSHQKQCPLLNYVDVPDILTFSFLAGYFLRGFRNVLKEIRLFRCTL